MRAHACHRAEKPAGIERLDWAQQFHVIASRPEAVAIADKASAEAGWRRRQLGLETLAHPIVFLEGLDGVEHGAGTVQHHHGARVGRGILGPRACRRGENQR